MHSCWQLVAAVALAALATCSARFATCDPGATLTIRLTNQNYRADLHAARLWFWNGGAPRGQTNACLLLCSVANSVDCSHEPHFMYLLVNGAYNADAALAPHPMLLVGMARTRDAQPAFIISQGGLPPWLLGANPWGLHHHVGRHILMTRDANVVISGTYESLGANTLGRGRMTPQAINEASLHQDIQDLEVYMQAAVVPGAQAHPGNFGMTLAQRQALARIKLATIEALRYDRVAWQVNAAVDVAISLSLGINAWAATREEIPDAWRGSLGQEWVNGLGRAPLNNLNSFDSSLMPRDMSYLLRTAWSFSDNFFVEQATIRFDGNYGADILAVRQLIWNNGAFRNAQPWTLRLEAPQMGGAPAILYLLVNPAYRPQGGQLYPLYVMGIDAGLSGEPNDRIFWFQQAGHPQQRDFWHVNGAMERAPHLNILRRPNPAAAAAPALEMDGTYYSMFAAQNPVPFGFSTQNLAAGINLLRQFVARTPIGPMAVAEQRALAQLIIASIEAVRFDYVAWRVQAQIAGAGAAAAPINHRSLKKWWFSLGQELQIQQVGARWHWTPGAPQGIPAAAAAPPLAPNVAIPAAYPP